MTNFLGQCQQALTVIFFWIWRAIYSFSLIHIE